MKTKQKIIIYTRSQVKTPEEKFFDVVIAGVREFNRATRSKYAKRALVLKKARQNKRK